jgi:hypothetical protein
VMVCTIDTWGESMAGCPRRAATRTGSDGRFELPGYSEWRWCCFGEAPRPAAFVAACASLGGQQVGSPFAAVDTQPGGDVRISVVPVGGPLGPKQCFDLRTDPRRSRPLTGSGIARGSRPPPAGGG